MRHENPKGILNMIRYLNQFTAAQLHSRNSSNECNASSSDSCKMQFNGMRLAKNAISCLCKNKSR